MRQTLLQRRTEMLNLLCKGVSFNQIVEDFATKYNVKPATIYQDWHRRQRWMSYITQLNDPTVINELLQGLRQIIPNAWYEYKQADNTNAKIGALRVLRETYLTIIEVLQSIGRIEKMPEELQATVKVLLSSKLLSEMSCNDSQPSIMNQTTKSSLDHTAKPNSTKPDTNIVTEHASAESEAEKPSQA